MSSGRKRNSTCTFRLEIELFKAETYCLFCIGYEHDTDWCADLCCSHREVEPTQKAGPQDSNISGLRTQMVSKYNILIIVTDTITVLILFSAHLVIVIHHDN